jgi:subtilisin family serine protease
VTPSATPAELASAIVDTVKEGGRVINLSAALHSSARGWKALEQALDFAIARGAITVAAAGNQAGVGGSAITSHPSVIPIVGCDLQGRPTFESNLGSSIARRGLAAPGENITSLGTDGEAKTFGGTSAAAPFVTGAIALLWSELPSASASDQARLDADLPSLANHRSAFAGRVGVLSINEHELSVDFHVAE